MWLNQLQNLDAEQNKEEAMKAENGQATEKPSAVLPHQHHHH